MSSPTTPPVRAAAGRRPVIGMLAANLISNLGNSITLLAVPWFVLQTTGSAGQMGLVAAATLAPMVISTFVGGALTDRMSHRQLAVLADVLSGVTVAAVPILYATTGLNIVALMALMFLGALFDGPGMNARMAMIPKLAADAGMSLERVNSGFGIGRSLIQLVGAPIGGFLIAFVGAANALWIDAATFAISALLIRLFVPATTRPEPSGRSIASEMLEGLRFLFGSRLLRSIALTATVVNMVLSPLFTIGLPLYVAGRGHDAGTLGVLMTAVAVGALAGSLVYGWIGERLPARATVIACLLMLTLPLLGIALEPGLLAMWVLLFIIDFGSGVVNPLVGTFFHRYTPERMLGRALGTMGSTAMLASPLGMLIGGALFASQGFGVATVIGAVAMLAVSVPLALNSALAELGGSAAPAPSA